MFDIHISSLEKKFLSSKKRIIHLYREPIVFFFVIYQISEKKELFAFFETHLFSYA